MNIKPCPFCNSGDIILHVAPSTYYMCDSCGAEGPYNDNADEEKALREWNTRYDD